MGTLGGYHYLGKRDAEAKSDAYLGYGLPYGSVYSPYTTLGGYHYLGKRDAEAKSDAWGYGLPLAYGGVYSPYTTYGGYHFGKRDAESKPWGYYGIPYGGYYGGTTLKWAELRHFQKSSKKNHSVTSFMDPKE